MLFKNNFLFSPFAYHGLLFKKNVYMSTHTVIFYTHLTFFRVIKIKRYYGTMVFRFLRHEWKKIALFLIGNGEKEEKLMDCAFFIVHFQNKSLPVLFILLAKLLLIAFRCFHLLIMYHKHVCKLLNKQHQQLP